MSFVTFSGMGDFPRIEHYSKLLISKNTENVNVLGETTSKCLDEGGKYLVSRENGFTTLGWTVYRAALMATRRLYLASLTYLDRQFGRILQAIKDNG